jgi:hypothetical protein
MQNNRWKMVFSVTIITCILFLSALPLAAQDENTTINHAKAFAISVPLRDLAKLPQPPFKEAEEIDPVRRIAKPHVGRIVDAVEQSSSEPKAPYTLGANIMGVGNGFPGYTVPDAPPDTNMAVGDSQILQWVNVSYTICSKTAPYTCGPAIQGNALWSKLGGICAANNAGDIIAQFDNVAHRWVLSQNVFSGTYGVCLAVSTSADATGTYYLYQFPVLNAGFPDYPKWGIWPTGYFETWNNFGAGGSGFVGPVLCAYNSTKLLAGDKTAEQICHQYPSSSSAPEDSLLPADRDSATAPPAGQDEFAIGSVGDVDNSHLSLYSAHINDETNWSKGATFTGDNNSQLLAIASFNPACNGSYGGSCVPQKGITDLVDSLGDRLMYRFAYWNDAGGQSPKQHWFVNLDVTATGGQIGVRWMEITAPQTVVQPTSLSVFQQGTFAPDGVWRWMGSVARDKAGDIVIGYSKSCGDSCTGGKATYPSIAVAGRTPSAPLGTMQGEGLIVAGTGSQPGTSNRWGDYSSMRIDQDGCTFWYTTEYYTTTQQFDWSTRIASGRLNNCK